MTTALLIHTVKLLTVYAVHAYMVSNPQDHNLIYYIILG